jgi:photosystem II stability/assembly factor-like uncharacterized protein
VRILPLGLILGALLIPPGDGAAATLFGLVDTGELYASTNNGATWTAQAAIPVRDAVALAAATSTSDLYLASRSGTIYRSTNGGGSWTAVGAVTAVNVVSMTILPPGAILVLTETGTLHSSTNQGASFTGLAALTNPDWVSVARGPLGRLYALTRTGQVAASTDNGSTWTTVGSIATSNAVAIRRRDAELFVMTETGELYRSINYGATWTAVAALTASSMSALVEMGPTLLASTREGEIASSANGTAWTWVGAINQLNVMALGVDTPLATGVAVEASPPPFAVSAPRPNPSSAASIFSFSIPAAGPARLEAYDVQGRLRAMRHLGLLAAGAASVRWEPRLAPGSYFVRVVTDTERSSATKWTIVR